MYSFEILPRYIKIHDLLKIKSPFSYFFFVLFCFVVVIVEESMSFLVAMHRENRIRIFFELEILSLDQI